MAAMLPRPGRLRSRPSLHRPLRSHIRSRRYRNKALSPPPRRRALREISLLRGFHLWTVERQPRPPPLRTPSGRKGMGRKGLKGGHPSTARKGRRGR